MSDYSILLILLAGVSLIYALVLSRFVRGLRALAAQPMADPAKWPSISVVMPARNEAEVLMRTVNSLLAQDYCGRWEVIIVDDRSTDGTPAILRELAATTARIKVITITDPAPASPKKNALASGIRAASGDVIVTTDADCVYEPRWLHGMIRYMAEDVGVVAGITVFALPDSAVPTWQKIQWLDFLVQQIMAAGAAGAGVPSSCNGSNLAFRRNVYDQISGYGKTALLVSGDDVLFAQRVAKLTAWRTAFAISPETIVRSLPVYTIRDVFHQRIRWASKGLAYRRSMLVFLFGIYLYYAALAAAPFLFLFHAPHLLSALAAVIALKTACDYRTVGIGCRTFGQTGLLPYFIPFAFLHTVLTPIFGVAGLLIPYRWKGEWYRTARLPRTLRRGWVRMRRWMKPRRISQPIG